MGLQYDGYLDTHRMCVNLGLNWMFDNLGIDGISAILPDIRYEDIFDQVSKHDESKYGKKEYEAYNNYFYNERTPEVEKQFDYAWLHHLHNNKHHWQYWLLKEDDSYVITDNGTTNDMCVMKALDMPDKYIAEMIADWWSFSWSKYIKNHNKQDLYEIFTWYSDHVDKILLSHNTELKVEKMLNSIKEHLDKGTGTIDLYMSAIS